LASKTADQENATAPLGNSETLSIKHSPESHIPPVGKRTDDRCKVPAIVAREQPHDVFKDHPLGP
jgi:hypothetical protein